ncbi:hypothetical protein [Lacticaseibacillus daqingensis]|nr:hypothetical protein [Lacticaseibacillus daqingensis]
MKKAFWLTAALSVAAATAYALHKLDWFHDEAKDYTIFESHRAA